MNALLELRKLLSRSVASVSGKVIEAGEATSKVQTAKGIVTVANSASTRFPVGSYVIVRDSVITGRARDPKSSKHYSL